jgi:hypothetical protein
MCFYEDGQWNEAEAKAVITEVFEIEKRDLGADYPSTLTSMAKLVKFKGRGVAIWLCGDGA